MSDELEYVPDPQADPVGYAYFLLPSAMQPFAQKWRRAIELMGRTASNNGANAHYLEFLRDLRKGLTEYYAVIAETAPAGTKTTGSGV